MKEDIRFALHLTIHPFDGFWDMKYEKKGKMKVSVAIMFLVVLTLIFESKATGFIFNPFSNRPLDIVFQLERVFLPIALFCVANWSVTTLMDGEGKMKEIAMATGYALLPLVLLRVPLAIITNALTLNETAYVNAIANFALLWTGLLLFAGVMTVHQYSFLKTIATLILTVFAMAVIIFIIILFVSLSAEIVGFFYTIYKELQYRL